MIKTIAILGAGNFGAALSLSFAQACTDGYVVDVFDPDRARLDRLKKELFKIDHAHSVWVSPSAARAAWGADVVIADLPKDILPSILAELSGNPNDNALLALSPDLIRQTISPSLSLPGHLRPIAFNAPDLQKIWIKAGIIVNYPAASRQSDKPLPELARR